jgi:hypothetical protein
MRKAFVISILLACVLAAGCKKNDQPAAADAPAAAAAADTTAPGATKAGRSEAPAPINLPQLAYSHSYGLELPGREIRPMVERHQQACADAGPTVCQVLGADIHDAQGETAAMLKLQAQPMWLSAFRARLDGDASAAGGKVTASGTESEDLSRDLVDTEAALKAKIVLRDRLQGLLAHHQGKLGELVSVEHNLAQVQGEIDAAQSELRMMRTRVQTSVLTVDYHTLPAPVSARAAAPLKASLDGAFAVFMRGAGLLVTVSAALAPFLVVGVPVWLVLRRRPRGPARPTV